MEGCEWGRVSVTGSDAGKLLQGQLTQDVTRASAVCAPLAAWCSPQGRILALGRLLLSGPDRLEFLIPAELTAAVARRLAMFVLRADARVADEGGGWTGAVVAAEAARRRGAAPGPAPGAAIRSGECWWIRLPGPAGQLEVTGPTAAITALDLTGEERVSRVACGLPVVLEATREAFIPQMLNLDLLDALSFSKGCYVGQEIVARTQHLGRIKRRMARYLSDTVTALAPGDRLFRQDADAGADSVAEVVDRDGHEVLAVVQLAAAGLALTDASGNPLTPAPLPYSVPELSLPD